MTTRPRRRNEVEDFRDLFKRVRALEAVRPRSAAENSGGPGLEDVILSQSPVGLWKLNEPSGNTALDSSGNGNHMTVPSGGYLAPTWGQVAGPPGTQSALWIREPSDSNAGSRLNVTLPAALTDNFSAGAWVRYPDLTLPDEIIGQGSFATTNSWSLWREGVGNKFAFNMGATQVNANNAMVIDTWYLVGLTRESGTTTLYVDGLAQSTTSTASPGTSTTSTWLGNCGASTDLTHGSDGFLSWAFITDTPISGAEWLEIHEAGQTGGALEAGLNWTTTASPTRPVWADPTVTARW